jgi:hypothetical protein
MTRRATSWSLGLVASLACGAMLAAPGAAAADGTRVVDRSGHPITVRWSNPRGTKGARTLSVSARTDTDDGVLVVRAASRSRPEVAWRGVYRLFQFGHRSVPRAYGAAVAPDACESGWCTKAQFTAAGVMFAMTGDLPPDVTVTVAAQAGEVVVTSWLPGSLRSAAGTFTRVTAGSATSVGVSMPVVPGPGAEVFIRAAAPGGTGGSVAIALLPCDAGGTGSATLSGAARPVPLACDTARTAVAIARGRTSWALDGTVAGAAAYRDRLLVVGL